MHYEPVKQETRIAQATNTNITISVPETVHTLENTVIEEFSEPEDLMEGIRGVGKKTRSDALKYIRKVFTVKKKKNFIVFLSLHSGRNRCAY